MDIKEQVLEFSKRGFGKLDNDVFDEKIERALNENVKIDDKKRKIFASELRNAIRDGLCEPKVLVIFSKVGNVTYRAAFTADNFLVESLLNTIIKTK